MTRFRHLLPIMLLALLASSAVAQKKVLGKLGQTTKPTSIYTSMNPRARVFYKAKQYEYIVINSTRSSDWFAVLMSNGATGYVKSQTVAKLPYEVTADASKSKTQLGSRSASAVAGYSLNFIGTPYVWGGNDPNRGIDCSGFVKQMFGKIGVNMPRTAAEQAKVGKAVTRLEDLQPGDRLYFWEKKRNKIGHTGIYLGNGYFVHSSSGRGGVATDLLSEKWQRILVAARRF